MLLREALLRLSAHLDSDKVPLQCLACPGLASLSSRWTLLLEMAEQG